MAYSSKNLKIRHHWSMSMPQEFISFDKICGGDLLRDRLKILLLIFSELEQIS